MLKSSCLSDNKNRIGMRIKSIIFADTLPQIYWRIKTVTENEIHDKN